jgi:hypothetical protein
LLKKIGLSEPLAVLQIFIWGYSGGTFFYEAEPDLPAKIVYVTDASFNGVVTARMLYLRASSAV